MDTVRLIVLVIHILGFAALIGGALSQLGTGDKRINAPMRDGAGTAFVAGLVLAGLVSAGDGDVNHAKLGAKLVIGLVVLGLVMANVRKPQISPGLFNAILGLSILNVCVAVLWTSAHV